MENLGSFINVSFKQLESLHQELKRDEKQSLTHIWHNAETGELTTKTKLHGNWKKIEVSDQLRSKIKDVYHSQKQLNPKENEEIHINLNLNPPGKIQLLNKAIEVFGEFHAKRLLSITDSNLLIDEINLIAKEHLESVKPLKDEQIGKIYNFLKDLDHSIEITPDMDVREIYKLLNDAIHGEKIATNKEEGKGNNSSYFLTNTEGKKLWVFKPENEENSLTGLEGIKSGEGAKREQVASLVNNHQKFQIPFTTYVDIGNQIGSIQLFATDSIPLSEMRCTNRAEMNKIAAKDLQYIMIADLSLGNSDGHTGNILCQPSGDGYKLFSIDHGATLSASSLDKIFLDYLNLKQIASTPLQPEIKEFIKNLDNRHSIEIMQKNKISQEAIEWYKIVNECLKSSLVVDSEKFDLFPIDIAFVLTEGRQMILGSTNKTETFNKLLLEALQFKLQLKNMNQSGKLTEKSILDLKAKMGNAIKAQGMTRKNQFKWIEKLFAVEAKNYCKYLDSDLILDF